MVAIDLGPGTPENKSAELVENALVLAFAVTALKSEPHYVMVLPTTLAARLYQQPANRFEWGEPIVPLPSENVQQLAEVAGTLWEPSVPGPLRSFANALDAARKVLS
jgi:hypothetical protein